MSSPCEDFSGEICQEPCHMVGCCYILIDPLKIHCLVFWDEE